MPRECCRAQVWPHGIFFGDKIHSWDEIKRSAVKVEELKYMPRWYPWNVIYRVVTATGKIETYATHEYPQHRNYRSWYHRNRKRGLCVRCSRPTGTQYCMCNGCQEKHRHVERQRRAGHK